MPIEELEPSPRALVTAGATVSVAPVERLCVPEDVRVVDGRDECAVTRALVPMILDRFEAAGIPYCVIGGLSRLAATGAPGGDVDCVVPRDVVPGTVATLLRDHATTLDASVVRWDVDAGHYITLARGTGQGWPPNIVHLHLHTGFQYAGREFLSAKEFLADRVRKDGVWVPASDVLFAQRLLKKLLTGTLSDVEGRRLTTLYASAPDRCQRQLHRFWRGADVKLLDAAAVSGVWTHAIADGPRLRRAALRGIIARNPMSVLRGATQRLARIVRFDSADRGMHVVFLGPDGVGKSTLIDAITSKLTPVFSGAVIPPAAPAVLPWSSRGRPLNRPHALPARPMYQSIPKAFFWLGYYWFDYYRTVRPALRAERVVASHRSLLDALVDSRRYRYGGPRWLLTLIVQLLPSPDVVFVLDAPTEVIQSRKQEVEFDETARQCAAYRALVSGRTNAYLIDAEQPVDRAAHDVMTILMRQLASRTSRRLLGGKAR